MEIKMLNFLTRYRKKGIDSFKELCLFNLQFKFAPISFFLGDV